MSAAPRRFGLTIRARLALLCGGVFFVAGLALVALMYIYLAQVLDWQFLIHLEPRPGMVPDAPPLPGESRNIRFLLQRARVGTLDTMLVASLVGVVILGLAAGAVGWFMAGQALQPLRQITATARRVADRSLHERIALTGPNDEIKNLADTLDAMLERLDRSFDSQRRFIANASHELRTPLTINRTLVEVAMMDAAPDSAVRQLGANLLSVNQRHERLIDGLLTLASSEQREAVLEPVDLAEIVAHIAAELEPVAKKAGVAFRSDLQPASVLGDPFLLERLIQNLIENAIQYNVEEGGWLAIATRAVSRSVELVVENTGPVVPSYEIPSLFEPFRRLRSTERLAGSSKSPFVRGAGLGLSIVRAVAHTHGGTVLAVAREDGGLVVTATFPSVPASVTNAGS